MAKCKNEFAVKLIKSYQKNKSVIGVGHCKFYPTCSNYAIETYKKFNFFHRTPKTYPLRNVNLCAILEKNSER